MRRYHNQLLVYGIRDYAWAQCWEDYRRMVLEQCLWPIVWHHFDLSPNVWWFALECTLAAFDDLDCDEFLFYSAGNFTSRRGVGPGGAVIVHHDRDPQPLYAELAEIGWTAERIDGDAGEVRLRLRPEPSLPS